MRTLLEEIKPFFSCVLDDPAFLKHEDVYYPGHFGDALLVFHSPELSLRFVRDRGQVFVDIGPSGNRDDWHNLQHVLQFLKGAKSKSHPASTWDLAKLGTELKANWSSVLQLFDPKNYTSLRRDLERFEKSKSQEVLDGLLS